MCGCEDGKARAWQITFLEYREQFFDSGQEDIRVKNGSSQVSLFISLGICTMKLDKPEGI